MSRSSARLRRRRVANRWWWRRRGSRGTLGRRLRGRRAGCRPAGRGSRGFVSAALVWMVDDGLNHRRRCLDWRRRHRYGGYHRRRARRGLTGKVRLRGIRKDPAQAKGAGGAAERGQAHHPEGTIAGCTLRSRCHLSCPVGAWPVGLGSALGVASGVALGVVNCLVEARGTVLSRGREEPARGLPASPGAPGRIRRPSCAAARPAERPQRP
jgi:hypothetical protein